MSRPFRAARFFRSPLAGALLAVLCLIAQWPGTLVLPPVDRDESRFAQAMRQVAAAAERGDWDKVIVPHIQDRPRVNKPPLVYWLAIPGSLALDHPDRDIGHGVWPLGDLPTGNIFAYRLVSLVSAMVAVLLTWRTGLTLRFHPAAAWLGAALLATCVMVMWDARQARADETLLACTTGAMLCLAHIWRRRDLPLARTRGWVIGLIIWLALGVLAKGISLLVVGLAATSLGLWTRGNGEGGARAWARHLRIPVVVIASIAPIIAWFITTRTILGSGAAESTAARETIWRALIPQESHWGPPGYHLVLLAILFFPGSLATGAAFRRSLRRMWSALPRKTVWTRIRAVLVGPIRAGEVDDRTMFCLAWILLPWIAFELSMTKLPHYTLPMYPAIALLSARHLLRAGSRHAGLGVLKHVTYLLIALAIGVGAPVAIAISRDASIGFISLAAAPGVALFAMVAWSLARKKPVVAQVWAMALTIVTFVVVVRFLLPTHPYLWVSSRVASAIDSPDLGVQATIGAVGYHEDSLIFLSRGRVHRVGSKRIEEWLTTNHTPWALVQQGSWAIPSEGFLTREVARGFNYSNGDWVIIDFVRRWPNHAPGYDPGSPTERPDHP